jgi:predicted 2-oxoglutarate/Fe(II)-dependent dioxygenase YbiX
MAFQSIWYESQIPKELVDILEKDAIGTFESQMADSKLQGDALNKDKRNSKNAWIPTSHWIGGFIWHYVQRANRENFLYDIRNIDGENIQFTKYEEGQFYSWHNDSGLATHYKPIGINNSLDTLAQNYVNEKIELIRKLSVVVQLSNPEDYEGGNLQLLDESNNSYIVPRKRGTVIIFDSRAQHRVLKITKGTRRSLVCWVCGPRWK